MSKEGLGSDDTARFSDDLIAKNAPVLSDEEAIAVAALPSNSALLVSHRGPGAGSRFLLDQDLTIAGRPPGSGTFFLDGRKPCQGSTFRYPERARTFS